jgi:hypothetical protein
VIDLRPSNRDWGYQSRDSSPFDEEKNATAVILQPCSPFISKGNTISYENIKNKPHQKSPNNAVGEMYQILRT